MRKIFAKADYVQAISDYLADFGRRHGARCPVEVVPNGVDLEKFKIRPAGPAENSKVIVTASRLVPKNGVDVLIEAAAELKKANPDPFIVKIAGAGPTSGN